jgi:hypothetical protein
MAISACRGSGQSRRNNGREETATVYLVMRVAAVSFAVFGHCRLTTPYRGKRHDDDQDNHGNQD